MTKNELVSEIAASMGTTKVHVRSFLEAFRETTVQALVKTGSCTIPDVVKIVLVKTPPRPERTGRNPHTKEPMKIGAKPAGKKLKARFVKALKERVGQVPKKSAKASRKAA